MKFDRRLIMPAMLSAIVLIPSATVLWLASVAARNERVAVRQRLLESFDRRLQLASVTVQQRFDEIDRTCEDLCNEGMPGEIFQRCVHAGIADSVVIYDSSGVRAYPQQPQTRLINGLNQRAWPEAEQLEFEQQDFQTAAQAYAAIALLETNSDAEAMAWIAHARCLDKAGQRDVATSTLQRHFASKATRNARDEEGRSLWLSAQLRIAQLSKASVAANEGSAESHEILRDALEDYAFQLPSSQRLFAMQRFADLFPNSPRFETVSAEGLAEQYVQLSESQRTRRPSPQQSADIVCVNLRRSPVGLLIPTSKLEPYVQEIIQDLQTDDIRLKLAEQAEAQSPDVASAPIAGIPSHRLVIDLNSPELFAETSQHQVALYIAAGVVTMGSLLALAILISHFVSRQLQLAQMKADLATLVTHELRTPLASIRLLVDTLLDGTVSDDQNRHEYLRLIAGENERLSRLIDQFLTFSAVNRNEHRYTLTPTDPHSLVTRVIAAMTAHFDAARCELTTQISDNLPEIQADADALSIVLINLLDNAIKFSGQQKRIHIETELKNDGVRFLVRDNGIGIAKKDVARIFDRFFQADQSLSRKHSGCGLGLNLVQSIVKAHGGTVHVQSVEDQGSEFTFTIPIVSGAKDSVESSET